MYPTTDLEPKPQGAPESGYPGLRVEAHTFASEGSRTVLLTRPGEPASGHGGVMILLSASLLRTLLAAARSMGPRRGRRRASRRIDMRV